MTPGPVAKDESHQSSVVHQHPETARDAGTNMEGSMDSQGPGANEAMYFDLP